MMNFNHQICSVEMNVYLKIKFYFTRTGFSQIERPILLEINLNPLIYTFN